MARREPAAVRSRIQSPSLISQVTIAPAIGLPCISDAAIARVSRKSTLSRPSRRHTRQARSAIGYAFHSINGMLTARTMGLALNASSSEIVGSVNGTRRHAGGGAALLIVAGSAFSAPAPAGCISTIRFKSSSVITDRRPINPRSSFS